MLIYMFSARLKAIANSFFKSVKVFLFIQNLSIYFNLLFL